jgi:hypothetical protein
MTPDSHLRNWSQARGDKQPLTRKTGGAWSGVYGLLAYAYARSTAPDLRSCLYFRKARLASCVACRRRKRPRFVPGSPSWESDPRTWLRRSTLTATLWLRKSAETLAALEKCLARYAEVRRDLQAKLQSSS